MLVRVSSPYNCYLCQCSTYENLSVEPSRLCGQIEFAACFSFLFSWLLISNGLISGVFLWPSESKPMLLKTAVGPGLTPPELRWSGSHAHHVVSGAGHGKNPIHSTDSAMPHLPHQRNRLQPAEALLDWLCLSLAEGVTCVPRGAAINRGPPRRLRFCATWGVTRRFWHSATNPCVSNPLSPPTVTVCVPGSFSNITSAARRSAAPLAWNTSASTIRSLRFSTNRFPV